MFYRVTACQQQLQYENVKYFVYTHNNIYLYIYLRNTKRLLINEHRKENREYRRSLNELNKKKKK